MAGVGAVVDVPVGALDGGPAREWWQVWAERRARWWGRHGGLKRRIAVVRTAGLWVGLLLLLVVALSWPEILLGMRAWVGACLVAVVWFFAARTKTLTWSGFMRFFAVCGAWSVVVALVLAMVSSSLGNAGVDALGPSTFVAGLGEESLKLVPLVVLVVAAPRRVARFAAVDWWLLGLGSGLAFELVEEGARRVLLLATMQREGILAEYRQLYGGGVPPGWTRFGVLPSDWSVGGAGFAGHAVATGMVAGLVGLVVVVWRAGRGRGAAGWVWPVVAAVGPVVCLVTMMADHLVFNAHADGHVVPEDRAWLDPDRSAVPWWLRVPWSVFGHGHWRLVWFVVLFVVCLAVDGYRLGSRPASSLAGQPMGPALGTAVARLWVLRGWWGRAWAVVATSVVVTGWVVVRDAGQLAAAHVRAPGEPVRAAMRRGAVAASTARALREVAMGHAAGTVRPARNRTLAIVLGAGLLVVALWLAPHLAAGTGPGLLRVDTGWLPGVLTGLSEYWNSLPVAKQIVLELALGAMFALTMGPIGWGVAGILTWGLRHGAGLVTFAQDPRAATEDYLANLTPTQLITDGFDLGLTLAPVNFVTGNRALARATAHQATINPVDLVNTRRQAINHGLPAHPPNTPRTHPATAPTHPAAAPTHPPATARPGAGAGTQHPTGPAAGPPYQQAGPTPHPTSHSQAPLSVQTHPSNGLPAHPSTSPGHAPTGPAQPVGPPSQAAAHPSPRPSHPTSPAPSTPTSAATHSSTGLPAHPSTGLPAHPSTSPGHFSTGPAHPTSPHPPSTHSSPGISHTPTSPAARPEVTPAQPQRSAPTAPPTRTSDPSGSITPAAPRSATEAGSAAGCPAAGELPSDRAKPRSTTPDTPRPSQSATTNHPETGTRPAARPDVGPVAGRTADHVATQKIPGLPRPGEPALQTAPEGAAGAASRAGGTPSAQPGSTTVAAPRTDTPGPRPDSPSAPAVGDRRSHGASSGDDTLLRAGDEPAPVRLPMNRSTVDSLLGRYDIPADFRYMINKNLDGIRGSTSSGGVVTLARGAFRSEKQLAITLVHERVHVQDLRRGMPYPATYSAFSEAEIRAERIAQEWWDSVQRQRGGTP